MSLSPAFLDELRARTTLSTLIARNTKLQRAGREWKACCPFHNEKTPSFTVSDEKGFFHCFGCGAHGDAISWLTQARGLAFMDAVKELADSAGMAVPAPDPRAMAQAERAAGLHEVTDAAARWFSEQLQGIEAAEARAYLHGRDIDAEAQSRFGLGFAPDSRARLRSALASLGEERLVEAGLLVEPEAAEGGKPAAPYDRFRGRIIFPIRDPRGRVIAFGGRILGSGEPKYLNSPDTPLFDKGRTLFNLDRAAPAARAAGRVIAVEGYLDVMALDRAGIAEAVAPLGTALTEGQIGLLWRLAPEPLLCFDGDAAGQKAAMRAALRALPHVGPSRSLAFVSLPAGKDPDDVVRNGGSAAIEALIGEAEPLVEFLWRREREAEPLVTPEQRAGLRRRLMDHVSVISDPDVRDQYRGDFLRRYDAETRPPRKPWVGPRGRYAPPPRAASAQAKALGRSGLDPGLGSAVLQGLARFPDQIGPHAESVAALPLDERDAARLRDLMLEAAMTEGPLDPVKLATILAAKGAGPLLEALSLKRGLAFSFTRRDADPDRACRDLALVLETLAARPELELALQAATMRLQEAGDEAAFREQQRLRMARDEADKQLATLIDGDTD